MVVAFAGLPELRKRLECKRRPAANHWLNDWLSAQRMDCDDCTANVCHHQGLRRQIPGSNNFILLDRKHAAQVVTAQSATVTMVIAEAVL